MIYSPIEVGLMTTMIQDKLYTADELLKMPDGDRYELVGGKLVERHMGMESSFVALRIGTKINLFLQQFPIGLAFGADGSYQCFPDAPEKVRKPDVSFIRNGRLPNDAPPKGHCRIPPDLAVEVLSPNDLAYDVDEKIGEYLAVGIPLIWIVNPPLRTVRIHRQQASPLGSGAILSSTEMIIGEDVLPGFSCVINEFFG